MPLSADDIVKYGILGVVPFVIMGDSIVALIWVYSLNTFVNAQTTWDYQLVYMMLLFVSGVGKLLRAMMTIFLGSNR